MSADKGHDDKIPEIPRRGTAMRSRQIVKITTIAVILVLVLTIFSAITPVIATPSESDVINTMETSSTIIVGGDKIYLMVSISNRNPGWPGVRQWYESYYEMYEYDTSTDTKSYMTLGTPIAASEDYLVYRMYYQKYWYSNGSRTLINDYYVLDLNTNVKTKFNSVGFGNPCDLWGSNMVSTLMVFAPPARPTTFVYVTDVSVTPYSPVFMTTMTSGPSISAVAAATVQIGGNYIAWAEETPRPWPAIYPFTITYSLKMMDINLPGTVPIVLHTTSATWLTSRNYFGVRINFNTMDDKIVTWNEYDLTIRTYEAKYIEILTLVKTLYAKVRPTGVNIAKDLIYYGFYDSMKRKSEIYEYDILNNALTNTGITGYLDNYGNGVGYVLAMRTLERQYGGDLNSDGDTRDTIIRYLYMTIEATIDIDPNTLNLESNGNWITTYIELPAAFDVNDIAISTVTLDTTINADWGEVQGTTMMIKFSRLDVENLIGTPQASVELTVEGQLSSGINFKGSDSIRAINP